MDGSWRLILLQDYNTRVVLLGTVLLGIAAGMLGVYLLLRRRALLGDAISHATLPGVALMFIWTSSTGNDKSLSTLLLGAAISGSLGGIVVLALRHLTKIREDAALGIVLSVFFGAGVALVSVVQQIPGGNAAGLEAFIYGKAAAMTPEDVWLSAAATVIVIATIAALGKELSLLCFDSELARSQGWPVLLLDTLLIGLVVAVTIVGLQAVGLILIIALLVIPAASARFWTHNLQQLLWISGLIGAVSCACGTLLSAAIAKVPSGATIVLSGCALFVFSFAFGRQRGVVWRTTRLWQMRREQDYHHFLRAAYELLEVRNAIPSAVGELRSTEPLALRALASNRHWSPTRTRKLASRMAASQLVTISATDEAFRLTPRGILQALNSVRDHRLLELYMMKEASAHVIDADREADYLEHGLLPEHLAELYGALSAPAVGHIPPNPHASTPTPPS